MKRSIKASYHHNIGFGWADHTQSSQWSIQIAPQGWETWRLLMTLTSSWQLTGIQRGLREQLKREERGLWWWRAESPGWCGSYLASYTWQTWTGKLKLTLNLDIITHHLQAWHFFLLEAVTRQGLASPMFLQVNVSNLLPTRDLRKNARQEKQEVVEYRLYRNWKFEI